MRQICRKVRKHELFADFLHLGHKHHQPALPLGTLGALSIAMQSDWAQDQPHPSNSARTGKMGRKRPTSLPGKKPRRRCCRHRRAAAAGPNKKQDGRTNVPAILLVANSRCEAAQRSHSNAAGRFTPATAQPPGKGCPSIRHTGATTGGAGVFSRRNCAGGAGGTEGGVAEGGRCGTGRDRAPGKPAQPKRLCHFWACSLWGKAICSAWERIATFPQQSCT